MDDMRNALLLTSDFDEGKITKNEAGNATDINQLYKLVHKYIITVTAFLASPSTIPGQPISAFIPADSAQAMDIINHLIHDLVCTEPKVNPMAVMIAQMLGIPVSMLMTPDNTPAQEQGQGADDDVLAMLRDAFPDAPIQGTGTEIANDHPQLN